MSKGEVLLGIEVDIKVPHPIPIEDTWQPC